MEKSHIRLLLLNILFIIQVNGLTQNIQISTLSENIQIKKDTTFTKNVSVFLKKSKYEIIYPIFYDSELEEISDVKVYIKNGERFKLLKKLIIDENDVNIKCITSKKVKTIKIPPETEAKITYTLMCSELMYFSNLRFFSYDAIDTLNYQITVPETFCFLHNIIYKDSLDYLAIDSLKSDNLMTWHLEVVPKKVEPDPMIYFSIYKNLKVPLMRTIVVPTTYKYKEKEYLNDWYLRKVEICRGLDSTSTHKIDELTRGISDPMKILDTLYKYVKTNFKYVAIEIGMGAFVPTHANEVFINKQGDCKDLSNFLSEALNYKGIKSYVALAATYNHICDCDFPSLCSANHAICVAYINDKLILLDPTDPIHIPQTPVESLIDRSILIINSNGGEFYKADGLPPEQNVIHYVIALKVDSNRTLMDGEFKANYEGISGNFLKRLFVGLSDEKINTVGKKHYESVFGNQAITNLKIIRHENSIEVEGKLSVNGKIFKDANNQYLFIDFLPRIIECENRETLLEGIYLGNSTNKKVILRITMDEPFKAFSPIYQTFSNTGVSLNLKISNPSDFVIEYDYEFLLDYIYTEKDNLDIINEILKSYKKITNEPIILKNKR